jgi:hypothetical protein
MNRPVEVAATDMVDGGLNIHISTKMDDGTEAQISFIFTQDDVRIEARNPFDGSLVEFKMNKIRSFFGDV